MKRETTIFICIAWALILVGVLMVYSASSTGPHSTGTFKRHLVFLCMGMAAMYCAARFDYRRLGDPFIFRALVGASLGMLILVLIPGVGVKVDGGQRWLNAGFFNFQPSEVAKLALVVLLAVKLSQNQANVKSFFKGFVPTLIIASVFAALVLLERDLGIPVMMLGVTYIMLFMAGAKIWHLMLGAIPAIGLIASMIYVAPHRMERLLAFKDPFDHRQDAGWQLIQSLSAFAQGGVFGRGAGAGEQKLGYLPAAHTDFIFAVIGEEFGLIGTVTVVTLFAILLFMAMRIAMNAQDQFGGLLASGIISLILLQAGFIMAVTTGLLPTKGLPLPFISYGGTALIVAMTLCGIIVNVGVQANDPRKGQLRQRVVAKAGA